MPKLNLSADELLTTTRAVRKRLDFTRPVAPDVIQECISIAQQAPTGSNRQDWHFLVVTDPKLRMGLGDLYRKGAESYFSSPHSVGRAKSDDPKRRETEVRVRESASFLAEHVHEVPVHIIPCIAGRTDGLPAAAQAGRWASIIPAAWSFMLAARARGLGTAYTTFHLSFEEEAANLLGIPFKEIMQAALIPLAYTKGLDFRPARREPIGKMVHWDRW